MPTSAIAAALVAGSPDAVLVVDDAGRYVDANPAACRLLGYDREDLLRRSAADVVAADPAWLASATGQFQAEGEWRGELNLRRKDGSVVPTDAWSVRVAGPDGELRAMFAREATGRRAVEAALRVGESRFRALVEHAPDMISILSADGVVHYASPAIERVLGYRPDDLVGRRGAPFVHPDDEAVLLGAVSVCLADPAVHPRVEVRVRHKDGSWRWLEATFTNQLGSPAVAAIVVNSRDVTDRRQAESALRESEERFRAAFEEAAAGVALVDLDGRFLRVNHALCAFLGRDATTLRGMHFRDVTDPADRENDEALAAALLAGSLPSYRLEKRYLRADGSVAWGLLTASLVRDVDGAPRHFIAQVQDISAQKRVEAALVASREAAEAAERRLRDTLERVGDGFYALDRDWRFVYLNPAAERMLERTAADLLGKRVWNEFGPAVNTELYPAYHRAMTDGVPATFEFFYPPLEAWFEVGAHPADEGLSVFFRDVTERRQAEDALRAHADLLARVVDAQVEIASAGPNAQAVEYLVAELARALTGADGAGVAVPDGDGLVYRAVAGAGKAIEAVRYPAEGSLSGLCLTTGAVLRSDDTETDPRLDRTITRAAGARSVVVAPLHHGGRVVGVLAVSSPRRAAFGQREEQVLRLLAGMAGSALTTAVAFGEARAARETAEEANRLKSAFLRTMTHELRTPLTAVVGYADLLRTVLVARGMTEDAADADQILRSSEHLLALIDDVLDLSRIEAGAMELETESVDVAGLVAETATALAARAAAKGLALSSDVEPGLKVHADPLRLRQVLLNLVGNALKFTERGGVSIVARRTGDGVEIAVADTGIGIAPEVLPHVFDEFRQADASTTRKYGGSGLGLAITGKLVELHGGAIAVESAVGRGTTFTVRLPSPLPAGIGSGGRAADGGS